MTSLATDIKFTKLEIVQQNSADDLQLKLISASQLAGKNKLNKN